ncbi:MAG: FAD:protein FMN transferase, partial [Gemmatimonadota bacterium]
MFRTSRRPVVPSVFAFAPLLLSFFPAPADLSPAAPADSVYHVARPAMGTTADLYILASGRDRASELFEAVFEEIERVEAAFSSYRSTSEVSRVNREARVAPVTTDPEVFGLIQRALTFSEETGGAFDITVGPLVRAWGFFEEGGRY